MSKEPLKLAELLKDVINPSASPIFRDALKNTRAPLAIASWLERMRKAIASFVGGVRRLSWQKTSHHWSLKMRQFIPTNRVSAANVGEETGQLKQPIRCPAGNVYDSAVHTECPCLSCWAERSSARLAAPVEQVLKIDQGDI